MHKYRHYHINSEGKPAATARSPLEIDAHGGAPEDNLSIANSAENLHADGVDTSELGGFLMGAITKLFDSIGLNTPSVREIARVVVTSPQGISVDDLSDRTGYSRKTIYNAIRRLRKLHIGSHPICRKVSAPYRGRGYRTILIAKHFQILKQKRVSGESVTPPYDKVFKTRNVTLTDQRSAAPKIGAQNQNPRKLPADERAQLLRSLNSETPIKSGSTYGNWAAEYLRRSFWFRGAKFQVSQILTASAFRHFHTRESFGKLINRLERDQAHPLRLMIDRITYVLRKRGLRAAHCAANALYGELVETGTITKPEIKRKSRWPSRKCDESFESKSRPKFKSKPQRDPEAQARLLEAAWIAAQAAAATRGFQLDKTEWLEDIAFSERLSGDCG